MLRRVSPCGVCVEWGVEESSQRERRVPKLKFFISLLSEFKDLTQPFLILGLRVVMKHECVCCVIAGVGPRTLS